MKHKDLLKARNAHFHRTGHKSIIVGNNFVECRECGRHAHIAPDGKSLFVHNKDYSQMETIKIEEF